MELSDQLYEKILGEKIRSNAKEFDEAIKKFMTFNINILDDSTLWVAIPFIIFLILVYGPLKKMIIDSLDKKILELKSHLTNSKKLKMRQKNFLMNIF